jgi:hypothetical protein
MPDSLIDRLVGKPVMRHVSRGHWADRHVPRQAAPEVAEPILAALAGWAGSISQIEFPEMPHGIADRDADVWEALVAVADLARGDWPARARAASVALVAASKAKSPSLGLRLLADARAAFGVADQMPTAILLEALNAMEDAPWGDLKGKAGDVLPVPDVPFPMGGGHSIDEGDHCARCNAIGCAWCEQAHAT